MVSWCGKMDGNDSPCPLIIVNGGFQCRLPPPPVIVIKYMRYRCSCHCCRQGLIYHPKHRHHCFTCCSNNPFEITSTTPIDKQKCNDFLGLFFATAEGVFRCMCRHTLVHPGMCLFSHSRHTTEILQR